MPNATDSELDKRPVMAKDLVLLNDLLASSSPRKCQRQSSARADKTRRFKVGEPRVKIDQALPDLNGVGVGYVTA